MKCLSCSSSFNTEDALINHYIIFEKLFQPKKNVSVFWKCLRCDDFITTSDYKVKHNFLKHYVKGRDLVFEDKPVDVIKNTKILEYEFFVKKFNDIMTSKMQNILLEIFWITYVLNKDQLALFLSSVVLLLRKCHRLLLKI